METLPIVSNNELAVSSQSAGAVAEIQAAYSMAMAKPRNYDKVRDRLLDNCGRRGFAEVARYCRKVGWDYKKKEEKFAVGWSIRTAEVIHTNYGNLMVKCQVLYDDSNVRKISCTGTDLETNSMQTLEGIVKKVVERKKAGERKPIYERKNSEGDTVYGLPAYESEVDLMAAALRAKLKRDVVIALVPGDLLDDMLLEIEHTLTHADAEDPIATRKRIVDQFRLLGIDADVLKQITAKETQDWGPAEFSRLRQIYAAVRTGETSISSFIPVDVKPEPERASLDLSAMKVVDLPAEEPPEAPTQDQTPASTPVTASKLWANYIDRWMDRGASEDQLREVELAACKYFSVTKISLLKGEKIQRFNDWLEDADEGGVYLLDKMGVFGREPGEEG